MSWKALLPKLLLSPFYCVKIVRHMTLLPELVTMTKSGNTNGENLMSVSAIVGTTALIGILTLFVLIGLILAVVDKRLAAKREH